MQNFRAIPWAFAELIHGMSNGGRLYSKITCVYMIHIQYTTHLLLLQHATKWSGKLLVWSGISTASGARSTSNLRKSVDALTHDIVNGVHLFEPSRLTASSRARSRVAGDMMYSIAWSHFPFSQRQWSLLEKLVDILECVWVVHGIRCRCKYYSLIIIIIIQSIPVKM